MHIRAATPQDRDDIHRIYWTSFAESERELVSKLAINLLSEKTTPKTFSLVAESQGNLVGHIAFSPMTIENDVEFRAYILAPLGVVPEHQGRGIGSKLIARGIQQISKIGVSILFVYGDPEYYKKFDFSADIAEHYIPPYKLQYPFGWQGITFNGGSAATLPANLVCVPSLNDSTLW